MSTQISLQLKAGCNRWNLRESREEESWLLGPINNGHLQNVTYTCLLQRQYLCNLYNRVSIPTQTLLPALFSFRNVRNPSLPICLLKKEGFLSKGTEGNLRIDGQACFPLMVFCHLCLVMSEDTEKFGCNSNGTTCVGSPFIWLIIRPLCTAKMKKKSQN